MFAELDVERSHGLKGLACGLEVPALVGVDAQDNSGPNRVADAANAFDVLRPVLPEFDFDDADAVCFELRGGLRHFFRSVDADGKVGLEWFFLSAEVTV